MNNLKWTILIVAACGALGFNLVRAAGDAKPTTKPATAAGNAANGDVDEEPVVTRTRTQDFRGEHFLYQSAQATIPQLGPLIGQLMGQVSATMADKHIAPTAAPIFVFKGMTQDPQTPFQVEVGVPVGAVVQDPGDCKYRELEPLHCAAVIYSGPSKKIAQAYEQVYGDLLGGGMQPTGESRQMHLYWDGLDSPNSVEMILIGVQ